MLRYKKVIIICHCILNCNSKVEGLAEYNGALNFNKKLIDEGFGIIQLPCPEMILYGIKRWGHVKEQFDNIAYRNKCREMLQDYIIQMDMYLKSGYDIKGIIAIEGSPSCGYTKTCSSKNWFGELSGCKNISEKLDDVHIVEGRGIFMDELITLLDENNLNINVLGFDESDLENSIEKIYNTIL